MIRFWLLTIFGLLPRAYNNEKPEKGFKEALNIDFNDVASLPGQFNMGYPHAMLPEYQYRINQRCIQFNGKGARFILRANPPEAKKPYDAAVIHTKECWKYPRFKVWLTLPEGYGHWASAYTYGSDGLPELDIFEWCKQFGNRITQTIHKGYKDKLGMWASKRNSVYVPGLKKGHTYCFEVEARPMKTIWRINGIVTKVRKQTVDNQQRIILINVVSSTLCKSNFVEVEKMGMRLEKLSVLQKI